MHSLCAMRVGHRLYPLGDFEEERRKNTKELATKSKGNSRRPADSRPPPPLGPPSSKRSKRQVAPSETSAYRALALGLGII
jgi:hypothetical protein